MKNDVYVVGAAADPFVRSNASILLPWLAKSTVKISLISDIASL